MPLSCALPPCPLSMCAICMVAPRAGGGGRRGVYATSQQIGFSTHSPLRMHTFIPYPYKHIRNTKLAYSVIDEVVADALILMGMLPTIERIISRKCER